MRIGTKSVLFGAHCFFLHPWFVAWAWWRLYGFPWDPRLWVAFFVHDLGYLGKPNMDGEEGEQHPRLGAAVMGWLFDGTQNRRPLHFSIRRLPVFLRHYVSKRPAWVRRMPYTVSLPPGQRETWYAFTFYHSRFLSKQYGAQPSRLCVADKLAIALTPWWIYGPLTSLTGERDEYMERGGDGSTHAEPGSHTAREWYAKVQKYCREWVEANRDGGPDTMTVARSR